MISTWLAIAGLAFAALGFWLQRTTFFIQYVFFLRFPLLIALLMVLLPLLAGENNPKVVQNWFELDFVGMSIVAWLAILLAWAVMYAAGVLFFNVASRNDLPFLHSENDRLKRGEPFSQTIPEWVKKYRLVIFGFLAAPIVIACWLRSAELSWGWKFLAIAVGILFSLVFAVIAGWIRKKWLSIRAQRAATAQPEPGKNKDKQVFRRKIEIACKAVIPEQALRSARKGYDREHDDVFTRTRALIFLALVSVLYLVGLFLVRPTQQNFLTESVPAISYFLVLLMLLTIALSAVSLFIDKYRISVLLVITIYLAWQYKIAETDHYYTLQRTSCPIQSGPEQSYRFTNAYDDWAKRHPVDKYPTMVVVAASGGGMTAAQWTAQVLSYLQKDPDLQARFGDSIAMVSAVSGGAVGSMYFVNGYSQNGAPKDKASLDVIENQAGRSSLGAVGWGIVYPDFLRLIGSLPTFFIRKGQDRGWAIEQRWAAGFIPDGTSMAKWRNDIKQGWRPTIVFNATVAETGERLVIAPVDVQTDETLPEYAWEVRRLLYPGDDIDVVTAARLSATFPYVTPIARPDLASDCDDNRYHAADGGYTDNFSVLSALDYLRELAPKIKEDGRNVVLLQIRASNPDVMPRPEASPGYLSTITGPFKTLLSVRTPIQTARNDALIEYLQSEWEQKKIGKFDTVIFQLYKENPLSWHLSPSEKRVIAGEWSYQENQTALVQLKNIMGVTDLKVQAK